MSTVYEETGVFTDAFIELHSELSKSTQAMIETQIVSFLKAQNAPCVDIHLINAIMRDIVDFYMGEQWFDCWEDLKAKGVQS